MEESNEGYRELVFLEVQIASYKWLHFVSVHSSPQDNHVNVMEG